MDKEIWDQIDFNIHISAKNANIENRDKPLVLLAAYGAMLHPQGVFLQRTAHQYKRMGIADIVDNVHKYHLGVYQIANRRLRFNKKNSATSGFANIEMAHTDGEYVIASVYAVPKQTLVTNGPLMMSEGCVNWDFYNPENQYILMPNASFKLVNINGNVPQEELILDYFSCYLFLAGNSYLGFDLKPEIEYKNSIVEQLNNLRSDGFPIPSDYIKYVEDY